MEGGRKGVEQRLQLVRKATSSFVNLVQPLLYGRLSCHSERTVVQARTRVQMDHHERVIVVRCKPQVFVKDERSAVVQGSQSVVCSSSRGREETSAEDD